jgi:hypothetical protein
MQRDQFQLDQALTDVLLRILTGLSPETVDNCAINPPAREASVRDARLMQRAQSESHQ